MKLKLIYILIVLILVLGCAQPPLAEMDSAGDAVFRAENDANAVEYASSTLSRARFALTMMQSEADSKRYDAARTHAAEAIASAERAIADGRAGAQRAASESTSIIAGLRSEIDDVTRNVSSARYSQMNLDYDALDRGIVNAYNTADQAEFDQAAGRYQDALDKARAVRADLANINEMIAGAAVIGKK